MPVEIEAKIKVDSLAPFQAKLKELSAEPVGDFFEINAIFDTDDRSLLAADMGLRVRSARNVADQSEQCTITYKGPRHPTALKSRDETELSVADFHKALDLLKALKYQQVLTFEKKRQSWLLRGCKIELDELPHLGTFVEIEGPTEKAVQEVQAAMGMATRQIIKTSYVGLVMSHLQDKGHGIKKLSFT